MKWQFAAALLALIPVCGSAQTEPSVPSVRATGEAVIEAKPDQARLMIGVVTQSASAQAAAADNANRLQSTLEDLRTALGGKGEIRTSGYALTPNYRNPKDGGPPTISGYTASNTIEVTTSDLPGLGKLIDSVVSGGANRIQGVQFTIKNEAPARTQALAEAVKQARANAEAMAAAMGVQLGRVLLLEQGGPQVIRPLVRQFAVNGIAAPTPIESGTVEVRATVTLTMEVRQ